MNQIRTQMKSARLALYPLWTEVEVEAFGNVFGETEYKLIHHGKSVKHVSRYNITEFVEDLTSGLNRKAKLLEVA